AKRFALAQKRRRTVSASRAKSASLRLNRSSHDEVRAIVLSRASRHAVNGPQIRLLQGVALSERIGGLHHVGTAADRGGRRGQNETRDRERQSVQGAARGEIVRDLPAR